MGIISTGGRGVAVIFATFGVLARMEFVCTYYLSSLFWNVNYGREPPGNKCIHFVNTFGPFNLKLGQKNESLSSTSKAELPEFSEQNSSENLPKYAD